MFGDVDDERATLRVSSMSKIRTFGFPATAKYFLSGEIVKQFTCYKRDESFNRPLDSYPIITDSLCWRVAVQVP